MLRSSCARHSAMTDDGHDIREDALTVRLDRFNVESLAVPFPAISERR